MVRVLALLLVAVLTGCAVPVQEQLSANDCAPQNWGNLGYADGRAGLPETVLDLRARQCAPYGPPVARTWSEGYAQGLLEYCTPEQGYRLGLADERPQVVCPREVRQEFADAYRAGRAESLSLVQPRVYVGVAPYVPYRSPFWRPSPWYHEPWSRPWPVRPPPSVRPDPSVRPRPDPTRPRPEPDRPRPAKPLIVRPDVPVQSRPTQTRPRPDPDRPRRDPGKTVPGQLLPPPLEPNRGFDD